MDIPFASSGAMNRAHYAFVRKVEEAPTASVADQMLQEEASSLQYQLSQPGVSQRRCKELLVLLMYCAMATTSGTIPEETIESALPHAITLAESGNSVQHKRIGYLFCTQMMPPAHELRLMLINTLRKDLENTDVSHTCLAMDVLIDSPDELTIPAVQTRLHDLLSHSSTHVRRRALLAFRALSASAPTLLGQISNKLYKRMSDPQVPVAIAATLAALSLLRTDISVKEHVAANVNTALQRFRLDLRDASTDLFMLILLRALRGIGDAGQSVDIIKRVIKMASSSRSQALLYECFRVLRDCGLGHQIPAFRSAVFSPVHYIRELLVSSDLNDQYIFLSCLECVDPILWAGTSSESPPVLEAWEVERVMQLLYSKDPLIRRKTLTVLNKVDANIVTGYYSQILENISTRSQTASNTDTITQLLEIIEMQTRSDGEAYAREIKELFRVLEGPPLSPSQPVSEPAVQMVLMHTLAESSDFAIGCAAALLTTISEVDMHVGPTLITLISALAVEYAGKVSVSPLEIMVGLGSRLEHCNTAVQDAILLAMLRLSVLCDEIPSDIISYVSETMHHSGRHIKRRCDQFLVLSAQTSTVAKIVRSAHSSSLPAFLAALQEHEAKSSHSDGQAQASRVPSPGSSPARSESRKPSSPKLRYKAYEPPPSTPPLRRRLSTPRSSPYMVGREMERSPLRHAGLIEPLSNTISPGELALVATSEELEMSIQKPARSPSAEHVLEDIGSRIDLIAFDTPTVADDPPSNLDQEDAEVNFEAAWDTLSDTSGARGWYAMSMEAVLRILQQSLQGYRLTVIAVDYPPFPGELKISIMQPSTGSESAIHALVRLKDSDEDSCLWRMRCSDAGLRTRLKRLFANGEEP